jgi:hypothetical protein
MNLVTNRALGLIVIGAVLYQSAVLLLMHVLQPEFSMIRAPMSAYVLGTYGPWVTTTYFVFSAALIGVAHGLARTLPRTRLRTIAFTVFLISSAGVLLAGLFPMDFPGPPQTTSGRLHAAGGTLAFPTMSLGTFLFSLAFRRDRYWKKVSVPTLALSTGIIVVFVLATLSLLILGFAGYLQRVLFALLWPWLIVVGFHLSRFSRESEESLRGQQSNEAVQSMSGSGR